MLEPSPPLTNGFNGGGGSGGGGGQSNPNNAADHHMANNNSSQTIDKTPSAAVAACIVADNDKISETEIIQAAIDGYGDNDDEKEPLGYQDFLCDVNIEYSPGGRLSSSDSNQHCFKMKNLPYMVKRGACRFNRSSDETSSSQSLSDCSIREEDSLTSNLLKITPIDVTKTTCAFLGNSEYVPNQKFSRRRVVLEMISAKLSQSTTFNVPVTTNQTNLRTKPSERRLSVRGSHSTRGHSPEDNASLTTSISLDGSLHEYQNGTNQTTNSSSNNEHNSSPMTSKKFVNYTILIKTAPGLDSHPAVIERRFSDFLQLNLGLKTQPHLADIVDKQVTFPKKVYMGNFSVANIAERSIVFAKLLDVCMTNPDILWSAPFISFLLDKELSEAHRLSLCGDPEDVQALIETVYFIEKKIYFNWLSSPKLGESSNPTPSSPEPPGSDDDPIRISCGSYSPSLPRTRIAIQSSSSDETISAGSCRSINVNNSPPSTRTPSSPLQSISDDSGEDMSGKISAALSQRVLVTFCILILTYYRGENYPDLKLAIRDFSQLVSSQSFVESVANTRHFVTLKACLLFLMNINRGNVINDSQRLWLSRRLEDIDGAYAETDGSNDVISSNSQNHRQRNRNIDSNVCRVTKGDLTSMLRDRNFCSFKIDKSSR